MSTLSKRGARYYEAGAVRARYEEIWSDANLYHAEDNPTGMINLGTAENYVMLDNVASFVNENVKFKGTDVDYGAGPWGSERIRAAMAKHLNKYFEPLQPVVPRDLVFSTGCTSICNMLGHALFEPGEGLLLSRPIYQAFQTDFELCAEVKCVFVSFDDIDQFTLHGVQKNEEAIKDFNSKGSRIKGIVLCNPHNPLGQCYEPEALIAYLKLCQMYKIHLIMDEVYALSIYSLPTDDATNQETVPFKSILAYDTDQYLDPNYLHLLYGFSKDLASGGLRLGCIWTRNQPLIQAFASLGFFSWPSNFNEVVGIAMLENDEWMENFVQTSRRSLGERSALARSVLDEYGIPYSHRARAGFFLWIDVGKFLVEKDEELTWEHHLAFKEILQKHKVYITGGDGLKSEKPGFFRLCYVKEESEVRKGLGRVVSALSEATEIRSQLDALKLSDVQTPIASDGQPRDIEA